MYKKYIKKNGKQSGPYYYQSVREKTGKIKSVYLGTNPDSTKFKEKLAGLNKNILDNAYSNGNTVVIPLEPERPKRLKKKSSFKKEILALKGIFNFEKNVTNIPEPSVNLDIPEPGKKDINFENLFFVLVSLVYVSGFFFLQSGLSSATGFVVNENFVRSSSNLFLVLIGIVNLLLILLIYFDLRRANE